MLGERQDWNARIAAAAGDEQALRTIAAELDLEEGSEVRLYKMRVASQLVRLRAPAPRPTAATPSFAARFGIGRITGDWLYSYRIDGESFAVLQTEVTRLARAGLVERGVGPALFVLWAAEWFRRCYQGGGHEWRPLCAALGVELDQGLLRRVTGTGLERWQRPVLRGGGGMSLYLTTLAREGGFPVAAVTRDAGGWAQEVLARMVGALLTAPTVDAETALRAGMPLAERLPASFRDDDFLLLCADLAAAIASVRRAHEPDAARAGVPLAAWLALNVPDWAEALPIRVAEDGATALVENLLAVAPISAVGGAACATRLLVRDGAGWRAAVRLALDGAFEGEAVRGIDPEIGRLRAHASGALARFLPGELALVEPPAEGETGWSGRSLPRSRAVVDLPFSVAVELDLRAGERRVRSVVLPGGKPLRGRLLIFSLESGTVEAPEVLTAVGGPGRYRAPQLFALCPADWTIEAQAGHCAEVIGAGLAGTRLWLVDGEARVRTPDGDCFRVRSGHSHDERDRIELFGTKVHWASVAGDIDLFVGSPAWKLVGPASGALYRRAVGTRNWRPARAPLPRGHYEIGWLDEDILLDRRRVAVLPDGARLSCTGSGRDVRFTLDGFEGCDLSPTAEAPVQATAATEWRHRPGAQPRHRFEAELCWDDPASPPLAISVDCPIPAGIARWDGEELPGGARVALADLGELVAHDGGEMTLFAELFERRVRIPGISMSWHFSREMPLSVPAEDIASLLRPISIDAEVRLGMHDSIETYWHVCPFRGALRHENGGVIAVPAEAGEDVRLCARALAKPADEVDLGTYSLLSEANHRPVPLPDRWRGTWLVYLRQGDAVVTRPLLHVAPPLEAMPVDPLAAAMSLAPPALDPALAIYLDGVATGDKSIDPLLRLAASLNGLPPLTFRVFELSAVNHPALFARMAFEASDAELEQVLALAASLPFDWSFLPRDAWDAARQTRFLALASAMAALGRDANRYAWEAVNNRQTAIAKAEPLLTSVFWPPVGVRQIPEIIQAFLNRSVERIQASSGSMFRDALGDALPRYALAFDPVLLETLDAPFAAGLAAAGHWRPGPEHVRRLKTLSRRFPEFFAEAYAASLSGVA